MCRLAAVHRVTQDVDTVAETTAPTAVEVITSSVGTRDSSKAESVLVDGITIDVIDVESITSAGLEGLDAGDRLFLVSHRWALDTELVAELGAVEAAALLRVAGSPAIVSLTSGALGGRPRDPRKKVA